MKDFLERARLLIANLLDRRRDTCWAELVMWAVYPEAHDFLEILHPPKRGLCLLEGSYGYCGKCDVMLDREIVEALRLRRIFYSLKLDKHQNL